MAEHPPITESELNMIIMAVMHDVKNSLNHSLNGLELLKAEIPDNNNQITSIEQEIKSVNTSLMRILSLYKMSTHVFSLNRDQHNLYDFLSELQILNKSHCEEKNITLTIDCDYDLEWYFDHELLTNVANSIINNNIRYAKKEIVLKAQIIDNYLHFQIEDDGPGYPQKMLNERENFSTGINFNLSNSGLGLYFAEKIAELHTNQDKFGYTLIENKDDGGGGRFRICIP